MASGEHRINLVDYDGPCRANLAGGVNPIGAPCSTCGHTNLVHPGPINPALLACAICEIQAAR